MFKRLETWSIVTAALIGLSSAGCGDEAGQGAKQKPAESRAAREMPPSVAKRGTEMTSVQPVVPGGGASDAMEKAEPEQVAPAAPAADARSQEEVLDALALAAERAPDDVRARVKLARALFEAGKRGEARRHAEHAIEVDEASASAWNLLGRIELADRDLEAAVAAFEQAAEANPDSSHAWNNLGYSLIELGRHEEAVAALEHATSGTQPTAYMWNNLGMAYEHIDRIREARAAYRQAAEGGSAKGQANLERLEGVVSLIPAESAGEQPEE